MSGITQGGQRLLQKVITFESVVVYFKKGRVKSIKRSFHEYGGHNVNTYIQSRLELILLFQSHKQKIHPEQPNE